MNETKRIINDYEIIQSFYVGEKEVVVGENKMPNTNIFAAITKAMKSLKG